MESVHYRTCNLCEAMCGLKITYKEETVLKIEGDKLDPLSNGHICPKAFALKDIYEDPDRLKTPIRKIDGNWESISWENAYSLIADKIIENNVGFGPNSLAVYQGNPSVHNLGTMLTANMFFKSLKTQNMFTATSVDQLPHHFASWKMFGHPLLIPIPDLDRTMQFIILGGNPLVSNGSLMSVPDIGNRIKKLQKRGGRLIVIDPRNTETAKRADQHIFIKPNTDAYLLAAIVNFILSENMHKLGKLEGFTVGLSELANAVKGFSPQKASKITGIEEETIIDLAKIIATTSQSVVYGRMGVSVQSFGGICQWLINSINVLTGNLDLEGGAMFTLPAIDFIGRSKPRNRFNRWQSSVRKLPEFLGELPVAALAEELETGTIKMMFTSCGNPVLSTPNGQRLSNALEKLDFMVSFDIYLNETTQHADLILPPATGLETSHYDLTFHNLAIRNTAKYSEALFLKHPDARFDWEIFQELGNVLSEKVTGSIFGEVQKPEAMLDGLFRNGNYSLSVEKLKENVHGLDFGPLKSQLPERLGNENKQIELADLDFIKDLKRLANFNFETNGYQLISKRHLRDNNSWMHNAPSLMTGKNRCVVYINSKDAKKESIKNGDLISLMSRVGRIQLPIEITEDVLEGVLVMPHGYGHKSSKSNMVLANKHAGESINDLTDGNLIDELTGNSAFSNLIVSIIK